MVYLQILVSEIAETWYFLAAFVVNCKENGLRLTGAGFKGACVALIAASKAKAIAQYMLERYKRSRYASSAVLDRLPIATVLHITA
jgi:galactokinase